MYDRILVPYDKSEHAKHALQTAIDFTAKSKSPKITVLYVTELPDFEDPGFEAAAQMAGVSPQSTQDSLKARRMYYDAQRGEIQEATADIVGDFKEIEFRVAAGKPQNVIDEYATTGEYDVVIMGCRGLGALRGALGSVSFAVLRSVDIPVLVVK